MGKLVYLYRERFEDVLYVGKSSSVRSLKHFRPNTGIIIKEKAKKFRYRESYLGLSGYPNQLYYNVILLVTLAKLPVKVDFPATVMAIACNCLQDLIM